MTDAKVELVARALAPNIWAAKDGGGMGVSLDGAINKSLEDAQAAIAALEQSDAVLPQEDLGECGENPSPIPADMVGCGKPLLSLADAYRCTHCDVLFHKDCAERHFKDDDVLTEEMVVEIERRAAPTSPRESTHDIHDELTDAMLEAGTCAMMEYPEGAAIDVPAAVTAIYTAMNAARPTSTVHDDDAGWLRKFTQHLGRALPLIDRDRERLEAIVSRLSRQAGGS